MGVTGDTEWADETAILDGKYIYSPRGAATATLTRYNIPGNTWETVTYTGAVTMTTGAEQCSYGLYLYWAVNTTAGSIIYKYSVRGNYVQPFTASNYTQSTVGNRNTMWVKKYDDGGQVAWLYKMLHTSYVMQRILIY